MLKKTVIWKIIDDLPHVPCLVNY